MDDFKEGHLKTSEPTKYRRLFESALRASAAIHEHRKVIEEVGPDPLTGRWHSQGCWAGGMHWRGSDMSGSMCWCGLQRKPEPPPEMRAELMNLVGGHPEFHNRGAIEAFLNKWGVTLPGEGASREVKGV